MTPSYSIAYRPNAAQMNRTEWERIAPLMADHALWLEIERPPAVQVRCCRDDEALHVRFRVDGEEPVIRHRRPGAPVYEDSCVEFFLQPLPGRDARYLNFEFNAAGALLLGLGTNRHDRDYLAPSGLEPFAIEAFGIEASVDSHGSPSARGEHGEHGASGAPGWELAFRIPFSFLRARFPEFRPASGVAMRGNFYKCGDLTPVPHYLSWAPVDSDSPDFHRSGSFGELILE